MTGALVSGYLLSSPGVPTANPPGITSALWPVPGATVALVVERTCTALVASASGCGNGDPAKAAARPESVASLVTEAKSRRSKWQPTVGMRRSRDGWCFAAKMGVTPTVIVPCSRETLGMLEGIHTWESEGGAVRPTEPSEERRATACAAGEPIPLGEEGEHKRAVAHAITIVQEDEAGDEYAWPVRSVE